MTKGRARRLSKHAGHNVSDLYGQERDAATSGLARMNMILHDNPTALIGCCCSLFLGFHSSLDGNPLDLVEADLVGGAVIRRSSIVGATLITADEKLAKVARQENINAWDCAHEAAPSL